MEVRTVESGTTKDELHPKPVHAWAGPAWVLYDVAYSASAFLFSVRYFPAWIINDLDRPDWYVSAGLATAVVAVIGAWAIEDSINDRKQKQIQEYEMEQILRRRDDAREFPAEDETR